MYPRDLFSIIQKEIKEKEVLILYGARQVGKTTLVKMVLKNKESSLLNCELPVINEILSSKNVFRIKQLFSNQNIVALDEAQKVPGIGEVLKIIYDDDSISTKIIATGSSSFELAGKVSEALTGRNRKLQLLAISLQEIKKKDGWVWVEQNVENLLVFGQYPGVLTAKENRKEILLSHLAGDYLYKDILAFEKLQNPTVINKLLKALALQIGSQVSVNELANLLGIASQTVEKYLDLLEKNFVIYRLGSYSRNIRNELKKSQKFYFYDLGIRNAILNNFSPLDLRVDIRQLWENFCINERIKTNIAKEINVNYYFWRTYDGAEINLIEEAGGKLNVFEFKWRIKRKTKLPDSFYKNYTPQKFSIISRENFFELME